MSLGMARRETSGDAVRMTELSAAVWKVQATSSAMETSFSVVGVRGDGFSSFRIWISYFAGKISSYAGTTAMELVAEAVGAGVTHADASWSSKVYSVTAALTASCSLTGRGEAASEAAGS